MIHVGHWLTWFIAGLPAAVGCWVCIRAYRRYCREMDAIEERARAALDDAYPATPVRRDGD